MKVIRELVVIALILFAIYIAFINGVFSPFGQTSAEETISTFIELNGKDEYVLSELTTTESFKKIKITEVFDMPIGHATAQLSARAHFKYYIKLAELRYTVDGQRLNLTIKKLYLSTPVAYDSYTVRVSGGTTLFGPNLEKLKQALKIELTPKLREKGRLHIGAVRDKSAKALADNMYNYFKENNNSDGLDEIVVNYENVTFKSDTVFTYED